MIALGVNSAVQFLMGTIFLLVALVGRDPQVSSAFLWLGSSMALVGIGLGIGANAVRKRIREGRPQARLTPEGQRLLIMMMQQIGWSQNTQKSHAWFGFSVFSPFRTASQVLGPMVFQILDQAAAHYNRIWGLLGAKGNDPPATLVRHRTSIIAAADEAMVNLINACAVIESMPESAATLERQVGVLSEQLRELTEQVDELAGATPAASEQFEAPNAIRTVLEQLKLETDARRELDRASEPEQLGES